MAAAARRRRQTRRLRAADQRRRLERLRARIVRELYLTEWREVWFFPAFSGVDGWQGTQAIMFVGLNPSTGRFPSAADQLLYSQLRRTRLNRAHLTDVIKERATGPNVELISQDTEKMKRYRDYLVHEIDITRPPLIVAMGHRTHETLKAWLPPDAPLRLIPHYAAHIPTPRTRRRFGQAMARIRDEYHHVRHPTHDQ